MLLNRLADRRVLFFGGKGGVGKTTCSSAFALAASRRGKRVLLASTDPAHSVSDIFGRAIGGTEGPLAPGLSAIEIDAERESARYVADVKREIERAFAPTVVRQAHRQIDMAAASPGLSEVALLERMIDLVVEREHTYDLIIVDTAPTGHTLQLLRMPDTVTTWVDALVKHRRAMLEIDAGSAGGTPDPIVVALERRRQRLTLLRDRVLDAATTTFVLVTIPERLAIEETARAAETLRDTGIHVGGLIVNRVLPDGLAGDFYAARKAQEAVYRAEIDRRFSQMPRVEVRQLPRDVDGREALEAISAQLATV